MNRLTAAVALAATVATVPAAAQQPVRLRFAPPVGQVTHIRNVTQTWMQIPGMSSGDTSAPTMTQTVYMTRTVNGAQGTSRIVTTLVDSSRSEAPGMGGMGPTGDQLRGMVTTQRFDQLGGMDSSMVTPPPGADPMIADAMRRSGGANRRGLPMPERPVRPGDTWNDSMSLTLSAGMGGSAPVTFHLTYRLDRMEQQGDAPVAVVSMTGTVAADGGVAAAGAKGTMSGTYRFDLRTSRILNSTYDVTSTVATQMGSIPIRVHTVVEALP